MNVGVIILTYNAEHLINQQMEMLSKQSIAHKLFVIDSSSTDQTLNILKRHKVTVKTIQKSTFGHGTTRQLGFDSLDTDIYVFMTQDAIPADKFAIENIVKAFDNHKVGCTFGKQLPHTDANILSRHARFFNYPNTSYIRSYDDRKTYGIKTCFNSNSFAAYRKEALCAIGGFPENIILGEDMYVAAKMLQSGWDIAYCCDAKVYHSHNYTLSQEFKRYFDIGVFHTNEKWIIEDFQSPNKDGWKYIKSELAFCVREKAYLSIIKSGMHTFYKLFGYKLGKIHRKIPIKIKKHLSMCSFFWE